MSVLPVQRHGGVEQGMVLTGLKGISSPLKLNNHATSSNIVTTIPLASAFFKVSLNLSIFSVKG